jgi:outer membrane protein TolC
MKSAYFSYQGTIRDALQTVASLYFKIQARVAVNEEAQKTITRFEGYTNTQKELLQKGFTTVIDYASQATALQEYNSRLYDSTNQVSILSNTLYAVSGLDFDSPIIPLLPAKCLPSIPPVEQLEEALIKNFEPLKVLDYQSYFLADQARASTNSILPTLELGYEYSYYQSRGNISGLDSSGRESISESTGYPYLLLSMNINLGGGQFSTANNLRKQSQSTQELREQRLKAANRDLRNNIVNILTNKELNRSYSEIKEDLNNILNLTNIGLKAGFVEFSTFQANQQRYFNSLINAQTALTDMYISYISLLRLTEDSQVFGLKPLLDPITSE